jgi:hypothetical protein
LAAIYPQRPGTPPRDGRPHHQEGPTEPNPVFHQYNSGATLRQDRIPQSEYQHHAEGSGIFTIAEEAVQ